MHLGVLVLSSLLMTVTGQQVDDDWIDPYDMLNYDTNTKTMRKFAEPNNYPNVPTKRREYTGDSSQAELTTCKKHAEELQKQNEEQQKTISTMSKQPSCNPVFKRFLTRLLKEMERVGLPSDSADALYDAKIRVSKQTLTELRTVLEGKESGRIGPLDNAVSQILIDLRQHDFEAWKWRFEDTFGVEIDTVLKMGLCVLVIVAIICTQLWSTVSWFVQFSRLFAVCFCISIIWNWLYLYKIAFAEHQNNIVKMDSVNAKCTGVKRIDWSDSLKEWFRSTWTLQDDPCKQYYEVLMVNPILLVPPTKAISVTITTFITEPLKHIGQGISEFLRALLKDLPVQLQIPVLLTIVLSILVVMYGGVNAAFQHGITAPFRRRRRDPPPPALDQRRPQPRRIEGRRDSAGGDAPRNGQRHQDGEDRFNRDQVRQRRAVRGREQPGRMFVETLRNADDLYRDERDGEHYDESPEAEHSENPSASESDSENKQETPEQPEGHGAVSAATQRTASDSLQLKTKPVEGNKSPSEDELSREGAAARRQPNNRGAPVAAPNQPSAMETEQDVQDPDGSAEDRTSVMSIETVGVPVQETTPEAAQ
ncbi:chloride channel CLIC-like protein 1 isoform X2 [Sphaeramia orbicularis]|uniref:Chloride channel CLIC-like protein 1 n=1 Tax=Sphaeramia orbicularis TaxID=375764 RepID=A0A673A2R9_9TELE|nr:chloride channel CLIC-like protein 1 isoform X2 [Sphaeramia orbicularis]